MLLLLLGFSRLSLNTGSASGAIGSIAAAVILFGLVAICFAKQRILHGTIGFFVFPIAIYGAARIGKPNSPWARWWYGKRKPEKQLKAERRFLPDRRTERFKNAFRDIVGGKPSAGVAAAREETIAATREATAEVRHRAEQVAQAAERSARGSSSYSVTPAARARGRVRSRTRSTRLGRYQFQSPSSFISAGTMIARTIVASSRIAAERPMPNSCKPTNEPVVKPENAAIMINAAAVMIRPVCSSP